MLVSAYPELKPIERCHLLFIEFYSHVNDYRSIDVSPVARAKAAESRKQMIALSFERLISCIHELPSAEQEFLLQSYITKASYHLRWYEPSNLPDGFVKTLCQMSPSSFSGWSPKEKQDFGLHLTEEEQEELAQQKASAMQYKQEEWYIRKIEQDEFASSFMDASEKMQYITTLAQSNSYHQLRRAKLIVCCLEEYLSDIMNIFSLPGKNRTYDWNLVLSIVDVMEELLLDEGWSFASHDDVVAYDELIKRTDFWRLIAYAATEDVEEFE